MTNPTNDRGSSWVTDPLNHLGYGPFPVTVTTWIITFFIGDPYKPSFTTVTGRGPHPMYIQKRWVGLEKCPLSELNDHDLQLSFASRFGPSRNPTLGFQTANVRRHDWTPKTYLKTPKPQEVFGRLGRPVR